MATGALDVRSAFSHFFYIAVELILLLIQYQRAEIFAFDVLPEFADVRMGFIYGSHVVGILWVVLVVLFTYVFWELFLKIQENGFANTSKIIVSATAIVFAFNVMVVVGEFLFFAKLIDDGATSQVDYFLALIIGAIGVGGHQIASLWIMKNVVRQFWLGGATE